MPWSWFWAVSIDSVYVGLVRNSSGFLHVDNLFRFALPDQRQQGTNDVVRPYDVGIQVLAQLRSVRPSVRRGPGMREVSGSRHFCDPFRRFVHDSRAVDEIVETLAFEGPLHEASRFLCALFGCELERDELDAAIGAFHQLLQVFRLLSSSSKYFGDVRGRSGCKRGRELEADPTGCSGDEVGCHCLLRQVEVLMSVDGGLTITEPNEIWRYACLHLCYPQARGSQNNLILSGISPKCDKQSIGHTIESLNVSLLVLCPTSL